MQTIYGKANIVTEKAGMAQICAGMLRISLPIIPLPDTAISIILFDSFGKTRLIQDIAKEIVAHFLKPDIIVCPEAKAIPVTQEMARLWDIDYFVLRKTQKLYMKKPQSIETQSITTKAKQTLCYDAACVDIFKGKKVMLFDDVISTGGTLAAMLAFATAHNLDIASIGSVFLEGESSYVQELTKTYVFEHLGVLPIIT